MYCVIIAYPYPYAFLRESREILREREKKISLKKGRTTHSQHFKCGFGNGRGLSDITNTNDTNDIMNVQLREGE